MTKTRWTQAMDGSPAEVDLFQAVANNPKIDGEAGRNYWEMAQGSADWGRILWQHGPLQEVGRNGILFEELLEFVVLPRLQGFNRDRIPCSHCGGTGFVSDEVGSKDQCSECRMSGTIPNPFRNRETSLAITHLEEGLNWLKRRTELRRRKGVEGTFRAH